MENISSSRDLANIYGSTWEENDKVFNYIMINGCSQSLVMVRDFEAM